METNKKTLHFKIGKGIKESLHRLQKTYLNYVFIITITNCKENTI